MYDSTLYLSPDIIQFQDYEVQSCHRLHPVKDVVYDPLDLFFIGMSKEVLWCETSILPPSLSAIGTVYALYFTCLPLVVSFMIVPFFFQFFLEVVGHVV